MIKFNDNNIIVGYIKELLKSVNLPIDLTKNKYDEYKKYNYTKNSIIKNLYYDSYTHRCLGNYLRVLRDYKKINLMQMYNCFSNEIVNSIYTKDFDSRDNNYVLYIVKVYPNKTYTIAIDSVTTYKLGIIKVDGNNNSYYIDDKTIINKHSSFFKPYSYEISNNSEYNKNVEDLRLIIKLPINNKSSITILEGDYTTNNNFTFDKNNKKLYHYYATNSDSDEEIELKSRSQLLNVNSGISYPFADRLIEYLLDNVITQNDTISDNIRRVQKRLIENDELNSYKYYGIWENKYRNILYNKAKNENLLNEEFDIIGYVDKNVETIIGQDIDIYNEE